MLAAGHAGDGVWHQVRVVIQKTVHGSYGFVTAVMLDAFGIGAGNTFRHSQSQKRLEYDPMARSHLVGELFALIGQKDTAVGASVNQSVPLETRNHLGHGSRADAEAVGKITGTCFSQMAMQMRYFLDIVLYQFTLVILAHALKVFVVGR